METIRAYQRRPPRRQKPQPRRRPPRYRKMRSRHPATHRKRMSTEMSSVQTVPAINQARKIRTAPRRAQAEEEQRPEMIPSCRSSGSDSLHPWRCFSDGSAFASPEESIDGVAGRCRKARSRIEKGRAGHVACPLITRRDCKCGEANEEMFVHKLIRKK